ncbi:class I SAM-dependent methyltransferase [Longimicrobium sp.]|uniref:class I SAM-dependent methyltransferase n=1 Tax=Longimicrobium sp. TaxID=2029185 RepID=UPI002BA00C4F|nr:methyltransferase domain-containing protein [Longimicrobium sp.]HSU17736.1 methyltransferase domain-containing protein [Longimicrobium sp.]
MTASATEPQVLSTTAGDFPLHEYHVRLGGREWALLHTGAILSHEEEERYLWEERDHKPYGIVLWPAAIALAHEIASRGEDFRGQRVLELGAGTGLPGIVAASLGARLVQTDKLELAMSVCRRNGERNGARGIDHRIVNWTEWDDDERYDWIIGSDVLYGEVMHPHLRAIFERNLAPGGRILLSDPFRKPSLKLLEALEADGWKIVLTKWNVGEEATPRPIGVFEMAPPR